MPASKTFRRDLVKIKACVGCRQRKQRCNAAETFPAPCSRCEKRGSVCQIDNGGSFGGQFPRSMAPPSDRNDDRLQTLARLSDFHHGTSTASGGYETGSQGSQGSQGPGIHHHRHHASPGQHGQHGPASQGSHGSLGSHGGMGMESGVPTPSSSGSAANSVSLPLSRLPGSNYSAASPSTGPGPRHGQDPGQGPPGPANGGHANELNGNAHAGGTPGPPESLDEGLPIEINDTKLIDGTVVSLAEQKMLYQEYVRKFHPMLPIVTKQIIRQEERNPPAERTVFWSMLLVSSTLAAPQIQRNILEHVRNLLGGLFGRMVLQSPRRGLALVVSNVLLSNWQIGSNNLQEDPGWLYSGFAVQLSLLLGLHTQNQTTELLRIRNISESSRYITWLGCAVVNYEQSLFWGIPPTAQVKSADWSSFSTYDRFTQELIKQANILSSTDVALEALSELRGPARAAARGVMARSYIESLTRQVGYMDPVIEMTELVICYAKLAIYSSILSPGTEDQDLTWVVSNSLIVAIQVPTIIERLIQDGVSPKTFPMFVSRIVLYSIIILYKLLASRFRGLIDSPRALKSISVLFQQLSAMRDANGDGQQFFAFLNALQTMFSTNVLSPELCSSSSRRNSSVMFATYLEFVRWTVKQRQDERASPGTAQRESVPEPVQVAPTDVNEEFPTGVVDDILKQQLDPFLWDWDLFNELV